MARLTSVVRDGWSDVPLAALLFDIQYG